MDNKLPPHEAFRLTVLLNSVDSLTEKEAKERLKELLNIHFAMNHQYKEVLKGMMKEKLGL